MSSLPIYSNWKHLRLPFQLTLAPIFLWGAFLARPDPVGRIALAFIAFHFFLYTGITAFNSWYDRDEGPIGGLEHPPAIHPSLLPLSLVLQAIGLILTLPVGGPFLLLYLIFVMLGVLYSHPRTRWKANPWLSALVVCGGQGGLGFLAGWAAAHGQMASALGEVGLLGLLSAAFTTFGMYPLTQVYQIEEDARRGDRTLCVILGAERSLRVSQAALLLAGTAAVALVARLLTAIDAAVLIAAYGGLIWRVGRFRNEYASLPQSEAFRTVLRLNYAACAAFTLFICVRLIRWA